MIQAIIILAISHMIALLVPGTSMVMVLSGIKNNQNSYEMVFGFSFGLLMHIIIGYFFYNVIESYISSFNILSGMIIFYVGLCMLDLNPFDIYKSKNKKKKRNIINNQFFNGFLVHFTNLQAFAFVVSLMIPLYSLGVISTIFGLLVLILQLLGYFGLIIILSTKIKILKNILSSKQFVKIAGVLLIVIGTNILM